MSMSHSYLRVSKSIPFRVAQLGAAAGVSAMLACGGLLLGACKQDASKNQPEKQAAAPAAPAEATTPPAGAPSAAPATPGDPLGADRRDPSWFRKEFAEGWTADDFSRTAADEQGRFASQILFTLPETVSVEDCVKTITDKVSSSVPDIKTEPQADGRVALRGTSERFEFSGMCGKVKGTNKAYISYRWTA